MSSNISKYRITFIINTKQKKRPSSIFRKKQVSIIRNEKKGQNYSRSVIIKFGITKEQLIFVCMIIRDSIGFEIFFKR